MRHSGPVIPSRLVVLLAASLLARPLSAATIGIKVFRTYVSPADGAPRSYAIYTPRGYDGASKVPAILFLHGRGGSALSFQDPRYLDAADANGTALIFWQGRLDADGILSTYYVDGANGVPDETDVLACLDDALSHFAIDATRVHLAGFSQGGKGALLVGLKNPDRFASIVDGSGPSDAFEGQRWSPTFPDFRDAAGGDASAGGPVLARWYAQSARFLLPNARDVPVLFAHGELDGVVPNSTFVFPYMNTHHVTDTPGFTDAWGRAPTMLELHAADPGGYAYVTRYVAGVGHDELGVLDPASLFAFVAGKAIAARPPRVVGTAFDEKERSLYWTRLARAEPADGRPAPFTAELVAGVDAPGVRVAGPSGTEAAPLVTLDLARAGVDATKPFTLTLTGRLALRVAGVPPGVSVLRSGAPVPGATLSGGTLALPLADWGTASGAATIAVAAVSPAVLETDLLAPALVAADGLNGARFETELVLANPGETASEVEALFLDGSGRTARLAVPPASTRLIGSAALFGMLGAPTNGAAPLRLRTLSGPAPLASERVFNLLPSGGTYGLSFPVANGAASVLGAGETARLVGPAAGERMNVSVFAPFEASSVTVAGTTNALAPLQRIQLGPFPGGGDVTVSVLSGRVQVYATTISNSGTNDPYRSPAAPLSSGVPDWTVPAVASAAGRFGASFSSDLALTVAGAAPVDATLTFRSHDGTSATASVRLAPLETRVLADVLASLFPAFAPGYGALEVHATGPLVVSDVTRASAPSGPASQDVACARAGEEATSGSPVALVGLAESARARTNVTLVNVGEAAIVTLRLLAEDGDRGTTTLSLAAGEFKQLDSVAALFSAFPTDAATLVVTPGAGARVVVSGARIDDATNDPTGLAPVPLPH